LAAVADRLLRPFRAQRGTTDSCAGRYVRVSKEVPTTGRSQAWQSDRAVDGGPGDYFVAIAVVGCPAGSGRMRSSVRRAFPRCGKQASRPRAVSWERSRTLATCDRALPRGHGTLLDHAWSGSSGVDAVVTALVLAASRPSVSAPSSGGPIRRRRATCALVATSRSLAALVAQHSFPNGTGILGRLSLLDRAESGSLAESAARATKRERLRPGLGLARFARHGLSCLIVLV
jgi:hypothetical protein